MKVTELDNRNKAKTKAWQAFKRVMAGLAAKKKNKNFGIEGTYHFLCRSIRKPLKVILCLTLQKE